MMDLLQSGPRSNRNFGRSPFVCRVFLLGWCRLDHFIRCVQLQPASARASSKTWMAIFSRKRARRSYLSIASSRFDSSDNIVANLLGPCGVEVKNFVRLAIEISGALGPRSLGKSLSFARAVARDS